MANGQDDGSELIALRLAKWDRWMDYKDGQKDCVQHVLLKVSRKELAVGNSMEAQENFFQHRHKKAYLRSVYLNCFKFQSFLATAFLCDLQACSTFSYFPLLHNLCFAPLR